MRMTITDRCGVLTNEIRELAERRLFFALSRFDSRVSHVELVVEDENGPRGGVDMACRISVSLKRANDVVVTDKDDDLKRCLSSVAERVGRAVGRSIERSQQYDRPRSPAFDPNSFV